MSRKSKATACLLKGFDIDVTNQNAAFRLIARTIATELAIDEHEVRSALINREKAANTALISGVAIPHVILTTILSPQLYVFNLNNPLQDWFCLDGTSVRRLICLIMPTKVDRNNINFKIIREIINGLADDNVILQLNETHSAEKIIKILNSLGGKLI